MSFQSRIFSVLAAAVLSVLPLAGYASEAAPGQDINLTGTWFGILALVAFVVAYGFVINEEFLHLRKSKPVIVAAGFIWTLVGIAFALEGQSAAAATAVRHNLLEYAELMLFLLAAMTYINTMEERNIFKALRAWLVSSGYSLRVIFWLTGLMAFFISPVADNLTTALLMAAVVMAVGAGNQRFVALACINIVVAANAGGAFSPFGDITTLMVWQKGIVKFDEFFLLFIPSVANWLIPAVIMSFAVPNAQPEAIRETVRVKEGGYAVVALFLLTIAMTVMLHNFLHMPPFLGMMTGLGFLKLFGYFIRRDELRSFSFSADPEIEALMARDVVKPAVRPFDIFISMKRAEWDTLLFFYGVVLCVGGLGTIGYLAALSQFFYIGLGATWANVLVGILSAIVDNIPVMFAVLTMNPDMSLGQWLLVTLTAGVGGSLLSIGSAAGVALMGQARGVYTFFVHLRWSWAVALGYAGSIWIHFLINGAAMNTPV
jgi:NhaD family Na+/H+ antiporter